MSTNTSIGGHQKVTEQDIQYAKTQIDLAVNLAGLVGPRGNSTFFCPNKANHDSGKPKASARKDGIWGCPKCGKGVGGDAISLLKDWFGYSFIDAVNVLNGRSINAVPIPIRREDIVTVSRDELVAEVDIEVYTAIVDSGDVAAAAKFFGRFGITPEVVNESRASRILDSDGMQNDLLARFGRDRLVACGVIKPEAGRNRDKDFWLVNAEYPVVEPHMIDDGRIVGLQFRGSENTEKRIKRTKERKERGETYPNGDPLRIPPKFLSLRGAGPASRVGLGIPTLAAYTAQVQAELTRAGKDPNAAPAEGEEISSVWVVEGFKDMLATRTMGLVAYGTPGAKSMLPVRRVCALLRPHLVKLALDGDEAGAQGREMLKEHFTAHGIRWIEKSPPEGKDMCDVLEDRIKATNA